MPNSKKELAEYIKAEAMRLGFSGCGISAISDLDTERKHLQSWLDRGFAAGMDYMHNNLDKRTRANLLVEDSVSIISLSLNYYPGNLNTSNGKPKIAKYALGRDYHKVMKKMLKQLFIKIETIEPKLKGRFFVDSAPVMDKVWAAKSGLGWQGKNGNLINKDMGSFFFIGEIICNLDLETDLPASEYCGKCTKCIESCPTRAITEAFVVDANRCISYQTIENKSTIDESIVPKLNDYIFGCDICQDVCPWNNKAVLTNIDDFGTKKDLLKLTYKDYQSMNEVEFNKLFNGTPVKRAGFKKIQKTISQIDKA